MKNEKTSSELTQAVLALRPYFMRAIGFSAACGVLVLAPSAYMLEVYDRVVNSRSHMTLLMLTIMVLLIYVVMEAVEWARGELMHEAADVLDRKIGPRVFDAIFSANLQRARGGHPQAVTDFRTVRDFLYSAPLLAIMEAPIALLMAILLFLISPVLGWSAVAFAVLQTAVAWFNERSTKPPLMKANAVAASAQQYADNTLRNAEVIEAMGMLRNTHRRWLAKQREFLQLQSTASDKAAGFQAVARFLQNVLSSLLLGLGAWLLLRNELSGGAGMMIVGSILGGRMLAPLVQVVTQWQGVVNARDAWSRVDKLLQEQPAKPPSMPLPPPRGALQVEQLVAAAPGSGATILRGVAFGLLPGEVLVVVGPSASGKTTLARLLVGLWPAQMGKVRLDGADVHVWNKGELGPHVGYLPQGVELFGGTIAENIARFGRVEPAKVREAAQAVGLHDFIEALPEGYDTQVGQEGARLSGGQRQRVALARALYGDPVYVVLDEPNSSLDEEGDAALANAIRSAKARGTTFVVMTHRTSILGVADKMLVLRDGMQQAFGTRDEVLAALSNAAKPAPRAAAQQPLVTA